MSSQPAVSIVVPTHNRAARLQPTLDALARQDWPPEAMEASFVADGCTDATSDVVAGATRSAVMVKFAALGPSVLPEVSTALTTIVFGPSPRQ